MSFNGMIEPALDAGLEVARMRATGSDVVCGLLAGLKRVRFCIEDLAGYSALGMFDSALRDRLLLRSLRAIRAGEQERLAPLPVPGAGAALAETVMVSAVDGCIIYAAEDDDLGSVLNAGLILLDRVIEVLGAAPRPDDLLDLLRAGDEQDEREDHAGHKPEFADASVH